MKTYQDKWTRWHDKPTNGVNYSSNNGWIYTAYAKYLAPNTVDKNKLKECYKGCVISESQMLIRRNENQVYPPLSKDEVLGLVSLGLLDVKYLKKNYWNYCSLKFYKKKPLNPISFVKTVIALYKIRKEERQYVWKTPVEEAFPLAFRLMPNNTYYVKVRSGRLPNPLDISFFFANALFTVFFGGKSSRMMLYLKMKDIHPWLAKLLPKKKWVKTYFGTEHPFYKNLK